MNSFSGQFIEKNNGKISLLIYRNPKTTDQYLQYKFHHKKVSRKVSFPPCLIEHIPLPKI